LKICKSVCEEKNNKKIIKGDSIAEKIHLGGEL
jgi:hypothetical protein